MFWEDDLNPMREYRKKWWLWGPTIGRRKKYLDLVREAKFIYETVTKQPMPKKGVTWATMELVSHILDLTDEITKLRKYHETNN